MYHLATTITGTLTVDASALTLAGSLHPTAAVCGTPASSAMDLIRGDGEWGLALHCGEIDGRTARLFAGCGIVAASSPAAELAEAEAEVPADAASTEGAGVIRR